MSADSELQPLAVCCQFEDSRSVLSPVSPPPSTLGATGESNTPQTPRPSLGSEKSPMTFHHHSEKDVTQDYVKIFRPVSLTLNYISL
ncbi:uncharacterized protein V6R79_010025 [Siganus canaliculatus]